ncbi:MAG: leucine-rich repeat domain-containing protein [Clostridia bacterium]|nr:leucine-rich repeat domain-containing protein [Clostridia bacterium]
MKKIFSLLMCAVMLFSFTGCLATPEPDTTTAPVTEPPKELPVSGVQGAFKFDEYSDHVVITQYIGKASNLYVPDTINGKPVTDFGTVFKGSLTIVSVYIGTNCAEIADNAFTDCYNLQRVQIDGGVRSIGELAFFGCQALKLIYIPSCVEKIADNAFKYCTDLIIYGDKGSEAERFAEQYHSIYFRDLNEIRGTTSTTVPVVETHSEEPAA